MTTSEDKQVPAEQPRRSRRKTLRIFPNQRPLSHVLLHFAAFEPVPSEVRRLLEVLADRGLAALLLLFGAFNMLPLPPGASLISGPPVLMLAWQMMLKRQRAWLPKRLLAVEIHETHKRALRRQVVPRLFWLEKWIKPRYWPFPAGRDEFVIGLVCVSMAVLVIVPAPVAQWFAAISVTLLAAALLQRDGIVLLLGLIMAALATALFIALAVSAFIFTDRALFEGLR